MAGPTKQWPRPPSDNPRDLYLWAQQFTDLLTQRWGPLSEIVEEVTPRNLGVAITGVSDLAAFLRIPEEIGAAISGVGALTGDIEETEQLGVTISGAGALTGNIVLAFDVGAAISGAGALTGDIEETEELAAAISGASALTGGVEQTHELGAAVSGAGNFTANIEDSLNSLSEQASATSTAATITVPASVVAGDILVLADRAVGGGAPSKVIPSGFTEIADNLRNETRLITSYKLADGTEAGNSITGMNSNTNTKCLYVFRGNISVVGLALKSVDQEDTNGTPSTQTVTSGSGATPLVVMGAYCTFDDRKGGIDPRGFSPAKDGEINSTTELYLAYKIYNSSPANVDVSMGDEGFRNILHSWYLEAS